MLLAVQCCTWSLESDAEKDAKNKPDSRGARARCQSEQENVPPGRSESHANAELAGTLLDRVSHYAGEAEGSETQSNKGEDGKEDGDEALVRPDERGEILVHRIDETDCLVLIEGADVAADGVKQRLRIAGGPNQNACARWNDYGGWNVGLRKNGTV